jgi:hypothetical protein
MRDIEGPNLFLGWKAAETTGASNLIVLFLWGGSTSESLTRSQMMTFQSFEEVRTYLEFRDQLHIKHASVPFYSDVGKGRLETERKKRKLSTRRW